MLGNLEAQGVLTLKHGVGIYVSNRFSHRTIVLLCHPFYFLGGRENDPFWNLLVEEAQSRVADSAESLSVQFLQLNSEQCYVMSETLRADLEAGRVQGILGIGVPTKTFHEIEVLGVPYVAFAGYAHTMVQVNNAICGRLGVQELARRGCQTLELWLLEAPKESGDSEQRDVQVENFVDELEKQNLPFDPSRVRRMQSQGWKEKDRSASFPPFEFGAAAAEAWSAIKTNRPDGIVILQDTLTRGAIPTLLKRGYRIGLDVEIVTHANKGSSLLYGFEDLVSRIEVDPCRLAQEMFRLLGILMDGGPPQGLVTIGPELVERG